MPAPIWHFAECFGLGWRSDVPLPNFHPGEPDSWTARGLDHITVERVEQLVDRSITHSMATQRLRQICSDGARIEWGEEAVFDLIGKDRISYCPGPGWTGIMPTGFYATIAALASAWHGDIPLHASAVEWQGRAILVSGPSGAGKSTSVAAMLAAGANFIGDDLTVIRAGHGPVTVLRGRPAMRLHADSRALVATATPSHAAKDASGKWIVEPAGRWAGPALPLACLILLGNGEQRLAPATAAQLLREALFRPRLQAMVPNFAGTMAKLIGVASRHAVFVAVAPQDFTRAALIAHGQRLLALASSVDPTDPAAPPI